MSIIFLSAAEARRKTAHVKTEDLTEWLETIYKLIASEMSLGNYTVKWVCPLEAPADRLQRFLTAHGYKVVRILYTFSGVEHLQISWE